MPILNNSSQLYVGLMSGTSMDAVDSVVVDFSCDPFKLIATHCEPFPLELKQNLLELSEPGFDEINKCGQLDRKIGILFANACQNLLKKAKLTHADIHAIGSHGQTVRHQPYLPQPFTLQIGDPNTIAGLTRITTIADFRRRDIVNGGQGAPLTPSFHNAIFYDTGKNRVVVNIGGISNLTFLDADKNDPLIGYDCGPGNTLLDSWTKKCIQKEYDQDGKWASGGNLHPQLLNQLLSDPYFGLKPPKSTGREYFNLNWLEKQIGNLKIDSVDVQTTLVELTALSISNSIVKSGKQYEIIICGGGVHNHFLMNRLQELCKPHTVLSANTLGVDPDWIEAIAFAWLAKQTLAGKPGNLPTVTGAKEESILGGIYLG